VAGLEGTGIVAATGAATDIAVGTHVSFRHPGAWAERVAVPAGRCYIVPDGVPLDVAAQFALNPVTAWALLDEAPAAPGDWIAVSAARSAIARIVSRLAEQRGVRTVGLARPASTEPVGIAVDPTSGDVAARILERTHGAPLAAFLDSVGGALVTAVLPALGPGATIISYGVLDDGPIAIRNSDLVYRNLTWKGFGIDHWLANAGHRRPAMTAELWALLRDGAVRLPVGAHHPLEDIRGALTRATTVAPGAKVLITM
jgi:NADPH:quinone reductase-like Zn-dependent oxidoreductase